ncbi:MAG: alpha-amylase family glycosyl hydrolase [Chitinophagaceae bacterium]
MKKISFAFVLIVLALISCNNAQDKTGKEETALEDGHPAWAVQSNIYEVNTRQYTPEGTFNAFATHLDRLKKMGVKTLWFMPINPISKKDRKRDTTQLGSYYAVANYSTINPEYGTMDDWKNLVNKAHDMGFKVIIDWVPTHSGADHYWLEKHPDFYVKDSTGKPISQYDWSDTRKLNYKNPELVDSMINAMKFWITNTNIDGFRCDVAGEVPDEFWAKCIPELKKLKNVFMLAEADKPSLHKAGFDASYTWGEFSILKDIAKGKKPASQLDTVLLKNDTAYPKNAMRMFFTSNHDENSWNGADFLTMPGEIHFPFAVLTQTLKQSIPLIYCGQEEPFLDSLKFFVKDTITFGKFANAAFYTTLLNLHNTNEALASNASFEKLKSNKDAAIYAFVREKNGKKIIVITNLSAKAQEFSINNSKLNGEPTNLFSAKKESILSSQKMSLPAWGYKVLVY